MSAPNLDALHAKVDALSAVLRALVLQLSPTAIDEVGAAVAAQMSLLRDEDHPDVDAARAEVLWTVLGSRPEAGAGVAGLAVNG